VGLDRLPLLVAVALGGFVAAWLGYSLRARSGAEPVEVQVRPFQLRRPKPTYEVTRANGRVAILLGLGPRSSTGYGVAVVRAEEQRGRVLVVVRERSPRLGQPVRAHVTYPAARIILRDEGKPVAVAWER